MKQITSAYQKSMKQSLRNRSYVKVELENVNSEAVRDNSSWVGKNFTSYSKFNIIDYDRNHGDTLLTLELNRWDLGKAFTVYTNDSDVSDGVFTSAISNSAGSISGASIVRTFTEPYTLGGFTIVFNTRLNEWADVNVKFYKDGNIIEGCDVTVHATDTTATFEMYAADVEKVVVTPISTLPYHRVQIQRLVLGKTITFGNDNVKNINQSHDVDPLSRRLPDEEMTMQILDYERKYDPDNPNGLYDYIYKYAPISVKYGYDTGNQIEWLTSDSYRLNGQPKFQNNVVTFTALGLLGSMSGTYYKDTLGTKTLYNMAYNVLIDANLDKTYDGENPWDIDESLKDMTTEGILPITTHANCLQLIAHASCSRLYTDENNIIHIKPFGVTKRGIYSGEYSADSQLYYSSFNSLDNGVDTQFTYCTLELNRWELGTTNQKFISNSYQDTGYISGAGTNLSGVIVNGTSKDTFSYPTSVTVNGELQEYSSNARVFVNGAGLAADENGDINNTWMERTFDVKHDVGMLYITFDSILNEYPIQISVQYYSDDELLDTKLVDVNTEIDTSTNTVLIESLLAQDIDKIRINFVKSFPYYRARINKLSFRETSFALTFNSIEEDTLQTTKIDILKNVNVVEYVPTVEDRDTTLYDATIKSTTLLVEFDKPVTNLSVAVEPEETLDSWTRYAQAAYLTFNSSESKRVTLTGNYYNTIKSTITYARSNTGEDDTESNQLITTDSMADALAEHVAEYLEMRNTYDVSYRGNPELETGDVIGMQTHFTKDIDALIVKNEIEYSGALSGTLKLKGLI